MKDLIVWKDLNFGVSGTKQSILRPMLQNNNFTAIVTNLF